MFEETDHEFVDGVEVGERGVAWLHAGHSAPAQIHLEMISKYFFEP